MRIRFPIFALSVLTISTATLLMGVIMLKSSNIMDGSSAAREADSQIVVEALNTPGALFLDTRKDGRSTNDYPRAIHVSTTEEARALDRQIRSCSLLIVITSKEECRRGREMADIITTEFNVPGFFLCLTETN